jgi:uncharacterized protein (TIGR03067 family)
MRRTLIPLLLAVVTAAYAAPTPFPKSDARTRRDADRLQGKWEYVELNGKKIGDDDRIQFRIDGNRVMFSHRDWKRSVEDPTPFTVEGVMALEPQATPKQFTLKNLGMNNYKPVLGIYHLAGDELVICVQGNLDTFPTSFDVSDDDELPMLIVCRRR